jgi:hypothetical protein
MNSKQISPVYEKAIKGYYLNLETLSALMRLRSPIIFTFKKEWECIRK